VQAQAGHLSQEMTRLYTHISQRAMQEAARQFEQRKAEMLTNAREQLKKEQGSPTGKAVN
jgi:hypothetical protein